MRCVNTVLKMWAVGIVVTIVAWVVLYLVLQAFGGDEVAFIIALSAGVTIALAVLVVVNSLKKQLWHVESKLTQSKAEDCKDIVRKKQVARCYLFVISLICCSITCPRQ